MKRRLFIAGLFAAAATVAFSDPTQARSRRRRRASRRGRRGRIARSRGATTYYQPTSYTANRRPTLSSSRDPYARTRGSGGRLTEENVYAFRNGFNPRQSREAMRSALGEPAEHTLTTDRWRISRTDIYGKPAEDGWITADYGIKGAWDNKAQTVKPPQISW